MTTVLIGILIGNSRHNDTNARLADMNARIGELPSHMDARFVDVDRRFQEMDKNFATRFQDLKDTWRAELVRVEEVLDARLKHLEER